MSYKIFSGISQQFYHTIPSELDLITTTPTREGIFKYLSQIGFEKFPEFILDILVKVVGHTPMDVTDGQGDEKQDILTINPLGERCLTQCKHTINYESHYNGDDLDLLVAACMRKNCKQAIFVTNSDLTPQGKKYITDKEYNRGFQNPNDCPDIEYWNGFKIWDKIKNNQDIINKWFSGLGQVHGLRSFKFDLTMQELPLNIINEDSSKPFERIMISLSSKPWIKEIIEGLHYEAEISKEYSVSLKRWFQFTGGLDINFILPEDNLSFFHQPLYALSIEVVMNSENGKFSPIQVRSEIVKYIADKILTNVKDKKWWHLTASQLKSFIYLHDISEPREIDLASASTFVKTKTSITENEFSYCMLSDKEFEVTDIEDDSIWLHKKTGIKIVQMFKQKIHPVEQYNSQIQQYHDLEKISKFDFYIIENIDPSMLMRVRRILYIEWTSFQYNENNLIWSIDPTFDINIVQSVHNKLTAIGLKVLEIDKEVVPTILNNVQKDLVPSIWIYQSERSKISYPVLLNSRIFWLSKELNVIKRTDQNDLIKLLKYKYSFENEFGFDYMEGKPQQQLNTLEIKNILFDLFTIRGRRMLDISSSRNSISINLRFSEGRLESSNNIAIEYLNEFNTVYSEINNIVN